MRVKPVPGAGRQPTPLASLPRVDTIDELIANNRAFAEELPDRHLDLRPSRRLAIVTCMDSRLDVFAALGLGDGEAHVLRNAGGVITDDVIRSLAVSQRRLGTTEVMLIHHTDCGMEKITDGPVGVGTQYRAKWKGMGSVMMECTRYDRPRGWSYTIGGPVGTDLEISLTPRAEGTTLVSRAQPRPKGLFNIDLPDRRAHDSEGDRDQPRERKAGSRGQVG